MGLLSQRKNVPHSAEHFSVVLDRERARADRTGRGFSLVVFDEGDARRVRVLQRILKNWLRTSDQVGWMDDQRIGVIVADTPIEGAWKSADDARRSAAADAPPLVCSVYSYPSLSLPGDKQGTPRARHERALEHQNLPATDETMATDAVWHDRFSGDIIGVEVLKPQLAAHFTAFLDFHFTTDDVIAEVDKVASPRTATGTHEGELMGIAPTWVQITAPGMVIHSFADGEDVEIRHLMDSLGMLQAIPLPDGTAVESWTWGRIKSQF